MLDIRSEMKLRIEKERRFTGMLGPVTRPGTSNSSTCHPVFRCSLIQNLRTGVQPSFAKWISNKVKWWGPVAERRRSGARCGSQNINVTFIRLNNVLM